MSNVTVQEALNNSINFLEAFKLIVEKLEHVSSSPDLIAEIDKAREQCKAALAEIDKFEPVAEAIRERDRLGFAVVNVIGKLDEIIENTQEVEIDDFLHIAVPIDMWNELQDALEDMPKRADLYTSPQPIEKCEPVAKLGRWMIDKSTGTDILTLDNCSVIEGKYANYIMGLLQKEIDKVVSELENTSPQPRDWAGLSDDELKETFNSADYKAMVTIDDVFFIAARAIEAKLKQLNTKG